MGEPIYQVWIKNEVGCIPKWIQAPSDAALDKYLRRYEVEYDQTKVIYRLDGLKPDVIVDQHGQIVTRLAS